jgi:hypothetical protein
MTTYQDEHRNSIATQASVPGPASVPEEYPLSSEFPGMTTYQDEHEDAAVGATRWPLDPTSTCWSATPIFFTRKHFWPRARSSAPLARSAAAE